MILLFDGSRLRENNKKENKSGIWIPFGSLFENK